MSDLKIGVLVSKDGLRKWQIRCLEQIREIPEVKITSLIQNVEDVNDRSTFREANPNYFKKIIRSLFAPDIMASVNMPNWLKDKDYRGVSVNIEGVREYFKSHDLGWLKEESFDILIRFGFGILSGEVLEVAKYGVWSFHHGDLERYRGRPPAFWEIYNDEQKVGITLQKLDEKLDAGKVIEKAFVPIKRGSYKRTLSNLYQQSEYLLKRATIKTLNGNLNLQEPAILGDLYKRPGLLAVFLFYLGLIQKLMGWAFEKAFYRYDWKLGVEEASFNEDVSKELEPDWLNRTNGRSFYADPTFSPLDSDKVFAEYWSSKERKGRIKKVDIKNSDGSVDFLSKDYHLSFPKFYEHEGNIWLVPEMAESDFQKAFLIDQYKKIVTKSRKLDGIKGVDPILFYHNNLWWAFTSPNGKDSCYKLNIYYSTNFFGPFKEHKLNPVIIDPYGGRMAGPIYKQDGKLYRLGQIYKKRYGQGVDVFEITRITRDSYAEQRVGSIRLKNQKETEGIHSVEIKKNKILFDGYNLKFDWRAGIDRAINKFLVR